MFNFSRLRFLSLFAVLALFSACSSGGDNNNGGNEDEVLQQEVVANYGDIVLASYEDSLALTQSLQTAINTFVDDPTEENFTAAKAAWKAAREVYGQTEAYRFYNGPIDDADGPEGLINAWPLDEGYIDYTDGVADSGIINNLGDFPEISKSVIEEANEADGDTSISTGYHAIEFLLWGQDLSDGAEAGQRPFTDFVTDGSGTAANQDRRGEYLKAAAELLIENLQSMVDEWTPNTPGNFRDAFENIDPKEAITRILIGAGSLSGGELGGERMIVALNTMEKEDEHSCFSDNTHRDFIANEKGIQNVYLGRYVRSNGQVIDGPGFDDLVQAVNPGLQASIDAQFDAVDQALDAINANAPFDQQILIGNPAGRERVSAAVEALQAQTQLISEVGAALELDLNLDLDGV
ncbi:MAG TPA: imelysin family protein [bacterium]|nr:imelysin family protein [bacterium]